MNKRTLIVIAALWLSCGPGDGVRSAGPSSKQGGAPATFDPTQSAALFVGVRDFTKDPGIIDLKYSVDDAVDLAYTMAMGDGVRLVAPERVVLALSGRPAKKESQERLTRLISAGAKRERAGQADVLNLLQRQAAAAGRDGILIVSFASHGFSKDGSTYILSETSLFEHPETWLPAAKMFDIASRSEARRSVIFVDACRERVREGRGIPQPWSKAPFLKAMKGIEGQVIFYAAAAGENSHEDDRIRNGVFTDAVIRGLSCKTPASRRLITVDALATFVENEVRTWLRANRNPYVAKATQVSLEGATKQMPLAQCSTALTIGAAATTPAFPPIVRVATTGSTVTAFASDGAELWRRDVGAPVHRAEVVDLDGDGRTEAVVGAETSVVVFDEVGKRKWSAAANDGATVRTFTTGYLFSKKRHRQLAVVFAAARGSLLSLYDNDGKLLSSWSHPDPLRHVVIDRRTPYHDPKIIVSGTSDDRRSGSVVLLDPKRLEQRGWHGVVKQAIRKLSIGDHDHDGKRDISVEVADGQKIVLNFDGEVIDGPPQFALIAQ